MSTAQLPPKVTHGPAVDSWPQWVSGGRDDTSEAAPAGATSRRMVTALATARRTARWTARLNAEPRRLGRRVRERWRLMQPRDSEAAEAAAGGSHIVQQGLRAQTCRSRAKFEGDVHHEPGVSTPTDPVNIPRQVRLCASVLAWATPDRARQFALPLVRGLVWAFKSCVTCPGWRHTNHPNDARTS
jgi:hypothetical protein